MSNWTYMLSAAEFKESKLDDGKNRVIFDTLNLLVKSKWTFTRSRVKGCHFLT